MSRALSLLLAGILVALWSLFGCLTYSEYNDTLEHSERQLGAFARTYLQYAIALTDVGAGGTHRFRPLDPDLDRADLESFIAAQDLPAGAKLRLRRRLDGFLLTGASEAEPIAGAPAAEVLTGRAENAEADLVAEASWAKDDLVAEWYQGARYESSGLVALTLVVVALGVSLARRMKRREGALIALHESQARLALPSASRISPVGNARSRHPR